jgi:hypothetical protein
MAFTLKDTVYSRLGLKPHTSLPVRVISAIGVNARKQYEPTSGVVCGADNISVRKRSRKFINEVELAAFLEQGR